MEHETLEKFLDNNFDKNDKNIDITLQDMDGKVLASFSGSKKSIKMEKKYTKYRYEKPINIISCYPTSYHVTI